MCAARTACDGTDYGEPSDFPFSIFPDRNEITIRRPLAIAQRHSVGHQILASDCSVRHARYTPLALSRAIPGVKFK